MVVAVCAFSFVFVTPSAEADPWGTNTSDTGAHPDAGPHTYCYGATVDNQDIKDNIFEAEWIALNDETQADVVYISTCNTSGTSETDVLWRLQDLPPAVLGNTFCEDFDGGVCDQNYVELDVPEINLGDHDEIDQTSTACHELGHSVGLTHGGASGDCMIARTSNTPPTELTARRYGAHHTPDHINVWF